MKKLSKRFTPAHFDALHKRVQAFMLASDAPEVGEAWHELSAATAPLFMEGRIIRRADIMRETFAAHYRTQLRERGALTTPWPDWSAIEPVSYTPDGPEHVIAWFSVLELHTNKTLALAVGLTWEDDAWRVEWLTLAKTPQPWRYRMGFSQMLADYPFMLETKRYFARTWLDAAYYRLCPPEPPEFAALPEARFSCHSSGVCCRHDYAIVLPKAAQPFLDALPWELIHPPLVGTKLPVLPDGRLQLKSQDETCRFLDEQRQCRIHKALGRPVFAPCAAFPMAFAETPAGIVVTASNLCGSVRAGLGPPLASRPADLAFRFALAPCRQTDAYRLTADLEVPWEVYLEAETALLSLLEREDLPLYRRLALGSRLLAEWPNGAREVQIAWGADMPVTLTPEFRETLQAYLGNILSWERQATKRFRGLAVPELHHARLRETPLVVRILRNSLYSKVYSYPYDLTTAHNVLILLYLLTLTFQELVAGPLGDELWQELASLGGLGLLKSLLTDSAGGMSLLLGSPGFGQLLLAYPF
jgi:hypothetical protein